MEVVDVDGVETVFVEGATVGSLATFINPEIPWVWILGHMPNRSVQWWKTELPLNARGTSLNAEYRLVTYDVMLETEHFLPSRHEFEHHGIILIQSSRRMPDTLDLSRIAESQQSRVLVRNGAFLRINLPHANETAQVQCFQKGYLATCVKDHN